MINDVVLEGIVVKAWKHADDFLFRLACYRDPDMPQKPLDETRDAANFVTIRCPYEILFRLKDRLCLDTKRRYWI